MEGIRSRPLKVGLWIPSGDSFLDGRTANWNELRDIAIAAEQAGFDSIWVNDHLLYQYEEPRGMWECWTLLTALAAVTSRVELGTMVACAAFRNPALLAKMADAIDGISNGRLILGLGAGYHEPEFKAFGFAFDNPVGRFEESLQIIRPLLRDGSVDFTGRFHQARCELLPRLSPRNGPPILLGGRPGRPRALRLLAQYGDFSTLFPVNTPERAAEVNEAINAACQKTGRDPSTLGRTVTIAIDLPGYETDPSIDWVRKFRLSTGAPARAETFEEAAELLRGFAAAGIHHVQLWIEPNSMAGVEAVARVLEILDKG